MTRYALVFTESNNVEDVAENSASRFEVHSNFTWIECGNETQSGWVVNKNTSPPTFEAPPRMMTTASLARKAHFGDIGAQLDMIYHAHIDGNAAPLATWAAEQSAIKALFPKDNHLGTNAAHDEIIRRLNENIATNEASGKGIVATYDLRTLALQLAADIENGTWVNPDL